MCVPARCTASRPAHGIALTGEEHEQIFDSAFDTGHGRDGAGGGSHGHTSQGRDEQQQGGKKKKKVSQRSPAIAHVGQTTRSLQWTKILIERPGVAVALEARRAAAPGTCHASAEAGLPL